MVTEGEKMIGFPLLMTARIVPEFPFPAKNLFPG
jgi:hypothetical protein